MDAKFCERLRGLLVQAGVWPADISLDERGGCVEVRDPPGGTGVVGAESPATRPSLQIRRILGGANNAVFRVDLPDRALLLKQYFFDSHDGRDRFGAEVAFVKFAWRHGLRAVPQLLATAREERLALFDFIDGRRVTAAQIDGTLVRRALDFCQQLQAAARSAPDAGQLPAAAEACFSLRAHLVCLERRIDRLQAIALESDWHWEARQLAEGELRSCWREFRDRVQAGCRTAGIPLDEELPGPSRCLSPSDFGFHNALVDGQGQLRFFDFEYAGWDDPAKLICDFFCQVEVPVPRSFLAEFARGIACGFPHPERILARVAWLFPLFQLKWCCIVLNEFLPSGRDRRQFSSADLRGDRQPAVQLRKARRILEDLRPEEGRVWLEIVEKGC